MPHAISMMDRHTGILGAMPSMMDRHTGVLDEKYDIKPDLLDLMERGSGGGALNTLDYPEQHAEMQNCYVRRERTVRGTAYHMFTESGDFLLSAHSCSKGIEKTSGSEDVFVFSQFKESSEDCFATLTRTTSPGRDNPTYTINYRPYSLRKEGSLNLGCISHDTVGSTPLYSMTVNVPTPDRTEPASRGTYSADEDTEQVDSDTTPPRYKPKSAPIKGSNESCTMHTREARWNAELQSYTLDYGGRALLASAKNFQLERCSRSEEKKGLTKTERAQLLRESLILQYGKIGNDCFNLDYAYPLCGLQAFAIALSTCTWN